MALGSCSVENDRNNLPFATVLSRRQETDEVHLTPVHASREKSPPPSCNRTGAYPHEVLERIVLHKQQDLLVSALEDEGVGVSPCGLHARLQILPTIPAFPCVSSGAARAGVWLLIRLEWYRYTDK